MVVLDDWFVKPLLFSFKSSSTYSMITFARIPALEDNDVYMGKYAAAYSWMYDTIVYDLEIIINQVKNIHAHMVSTLFQGLASSKLEITNLSLGLAHLGFDMVCYKFFDRITLYAAVMECAETLYRFGQNYTANLCTPLMHMVRAKLQLVVHISEGKVAHISYFNLLFIQQFR
ncbi:uncharacterized protein LOC141652256 [Silene latifolia]|uniref:uncharacterized protein LOC141652256 n=1 Tax=Silene latifolia TaxID=37657 RepID=UPI003D7864DB